MEAGCSEGEVASAVLEVVEEMGRAGLRLADEVQVCVLCMIRYYCMIRY